MNTCQWPKDNESFVEFDIYDLNTTWNRVAGVYIFTYFNGQNWFPLYVGQTDNFADRIPNHERMKEALHNGMTNIHARVVPHASDRLELEQTLIQYLQPEMNVQLR